MDDFDALMSFLATYGFLCFILLVAGISIAWQIVAIRLRDGALQDLASRAGLTYERGGFLRSGVVTGLYSGRPVLVRAYQRRSGRSSYTYTRIDVGAQQAQLNRFQLSNANILSRSGMMKSVPTGDSEFDRRHRLVVQPEGVASAVLGANFGLRNGLMGLGRYTIAFGMGTLRFDQRGFKRDSGYHRQVMDVMVELAGALETYAAQGGSTSTSYDGLSNSDDDW